jgi:Holliday junction resolvase
MTRRGQLANLEVIKMTEQAIQKKITDKLTANGWHVVKVIRCNKPGTPDLVACKGTACMWVEVKKPGGKLSKLQEYRIKEMQDKGLQVMVAYGVDDIKI